MQTNRGEAHLKDIAKEQAKIRKLKEEEMVRKYNLKIEEIKEKYEEKPNWV